MYHKPVDDPVFSSHTPVLGYYGSDYVLGNFMCTEQYQYCNPVNNRCSPLGGFDVLLNPESSDSYRDLSGFQRAMLLRIGHSNLGPSMHFIVHGLGASALQAQTSLVQFGAISAWLPNNQWQIETEGLFQMALAKLQAEAVAFARKENLGEYETLVYPDSVSAAWDRMCKSQKIRSTSAYQSFSILGIAIIVVVGIVIIMLSFFIDVLIFWCYRRLPFLRKYQYKRRQYISDGQLQLQRMAFEEAGYGDWRGYEEKVPTTKQWNQPLSVPSEHTLGRIGFPRAGNTRTDEQSWNEGSVEQVKVEPKMDVSSYPVEQHQALLSGNR